jgi:hypothetical protein
MAGKEAKAVRVAEICFILVLGFVLVGMQTPRDRVSDERLFRSSLD